MTPRFALLPIAAAALLLAACGGKSDPPAPATNAVSGVVADGPLQGATVCYDLNDNAACDSGEPSAVTDADGLYTFNVPATAAGNHAVVAQVPATAIDKDTGAPVGAAFVLRSPPTGASGTQSVFVSPLTTLVADIADERGIPVAEAAATVRGQLGLTNSPLANFVAGADTQAATLARAVNTVIVQVTQLADAANVPDDAALALVRSVSSGDLSTLAALVAGATGTTPAAVAAEVADAVLEDRNLSAQTVAAQAAVAQQVTAAPPATATTGPFVSVRRFTWTDANTHQLQAFVGDSTPAANGRFLVSETRVNRNAGNDVAFNRNTAYWVKDGSAAGGSWVVCPLAWEIIDVTPATATTPQLSTFCGASRTSAKISEYSVAGQRMADVVAAIRAWPLRDTPGFDTDATGLPTRWGPAPAALGDAVFPDGAAFSIRESTQEVGDTDRFNLTDRPRVIPASGTGTYRHAATFADLKRMSGNLVDAAATVSNLNTIFIEDLPFDQTDANLLDIKRYRAGFDPAGDAVRFYTCDVLASNSTSINCVAAGNGTSAITAQADSRVLRFTAGYPAALVTALKRQRIFVERSGIVFGGARDLERRVFQQRPNTVAWNALRTALGMAEPAAPVAPVALGPFRILRNFTYTDVNNYNVREFVGDSSTADAQGNYLIDEVRRIRSGGVDTPFQRNALYWTGSAWFDCGNTGTGILRASTVAPAFASSYCGVFDDDRYNTAVVTLAGRNMAEVVREIRWYATPEFTYGFSYASWGPNPDTTPALASATFPAGATMEYRGNTRKATPLSIFTGASSRVRVPPADTSVPFDTWPYATTLDEFIAKYPGDLLGGPLNGATAFFVNNWFLATPPAPEYTTQVQIRVAFDANGNKARFWRNYIAAATGFTTAYSLLLDTTYTVETLGGKRVLRFAALPDGYEADFGFSRAFAEHDGSVWYAGKDSVPDRPVYQIRMNAAAGTALLQALGVGPAP